jgi:hypothetical protein
VCHPVYPPAASVTVDVATSIRRVVASATPSVTIGRTRRRVPTTGVDTVYPEGGLAVASRSRSRRMTPQAKRPPLSPVWSVIASGPGALPGVEDW